jgi:hypothetical protein
MIHVKDIKTSIAFYQQLGFKVIDTDDCKPLGWSRIHCEEGAMMSLRAEHDVNASAQAVIFAMHTPDIARLRERMITAGWNPSRLIDWSDFEQKNLGETSRRTHASDLTQP